MCGILLVKHRQAIDVAHHLKAFEHVSRRGPDAVFWQHHNNIFIAQSLLSITGDSGWYTQPRTDFLAYNGEIYNWQRWLTGKTDTELVYQTVHEKQWHNFAKFEGAWAWAYTDFESVWYASDAQGERCLYRYQDDNILIVSSEVAAILHYIKPELLVETYQQKHWPVFQQTPWQGIQRLEPGYLYHEQHRTLCLDSIFLWRKHSHIITAQEAWEEFRPLWSRVIKDMTPTTAYGVTMSGGIDSSVIMASLPQASHFYTVDVKGKDTVSSQVTEFLSPQHQHKLVKIDLDEQQWAQHFWQVIETSVMPVQSWSFVGQWCIARHCQEPVLFTGVGADELFGGYDIYRNLDYSDKGSVSPYSVCDHNNTLWRQCLAMYDQDARPATLLMDYITQVSAVDMRGVDTLTMACGIEPRSPFCHPAIIKFALNLPWNLRLGKPLLKKLFLETWPENLIFAKQGFAGHCNDSFKYLGLDCVRHPDRHTDWKLINQAAFVKFADKLTSQYNDKTRMAQNGNYRVAV